MAAILCGMTVGTTCHKAQAAAIGSWRIYAAYSNITDIEPAGNMVWALSSGSLFSYNVNDGGVAVYNKMNCLSDYGIRHIAWNRNVKRLIITYNNHNIDLIDNAGEVTNISDYYYKSMTEDKTINKISMAGVYAYLSTNFGIIKINMREWEVSETYNLGMKVTDCTVSGNRIYAKTNNGIYSATTSSNLIDRNNWQADPQGGNVSFASDNDIQTTTAHGYTERRVYDKTNRCWWSNQKDNKLQSYTEDGDNGQVITRRDICPDGPRHNHFAFMRCYDGKLYTCGSYTWDLGYDATIQALGNNRWNIYQSEGVPEQTGVRFADMLSVAVDPFDTRHVMGLARNGVYEYYDGKFVKLHNSESTDGLIGSTISSSDPNVKEYELITTGCFDNNGNLWCYNRKRESGSRLLCLDRNGNWSGHVDNSALEKNFGKSMMTDSRGFVWFTNAYDNNTAVYRYDPQNDVLHIYNNFTNQDNINYNITSCTAVAEDLDGNMWVGTNYGPFMLNEEQINDPQAGFTQIKIPRNDGTDNADYLLANIPIMDIAVDGANRKWLATNHNGAYLISGDNMEELEHFTSTNSKLLTDELQSIAINNTTGEVFFGAENGLCSYMSNATASNENMTKDNVYAYPNPVTPGYTGLITVVGLSFNANVKILASNGVVVAEGTSNGGMFTWDGCDSKGRRVASGVYMVATAKSDGSKGTVCKIAIVR